ncbi:hypothetical protein FOZ61_003583 [Perkinsus olseni]|uniref:1,3-beta-glucanosyltransferase n=1 Tax=Perkinsus olseni TaxID=32597 RepID=A0A7J6LP63_PEROL|nr:hypothetical protein FOZ61_003583 [Perkinsus olseni]
MIYLSCLILGVLFDLPYAQINSTNKDRHRVLNGGIIEVPVRNSSIEGSSTLKSITIFIDGQLLHPFIDTGAGWTLIPHLESFGSEACKKWSFGCISCKTSKCTTNKPKLLHVNYGICRAEFFVYDGLLEIQQHKIKNFRFGLMTSWKGCPAAHPPASIGLEPEWGHPGKKDHFVYQLVSAGAIDSAVASIALTRDTKLVTFGGGFRVPQVYFTSTSQDRWQVNMESLVVAGGGPSQYYPIDIYWYGKCKDFNLDALKDSTIGFGLQTSSVPYTARVRLSKLLFIVEEYCTFDLRATAEEQLDWDWLLGDAFFDSHYVQFFYDTKSIGLTERL